MIGLLNMFNGKQTNIHMQENKNKNEKIVRSKLAI